VLRRWTRGGEKKRRQHEKGVCWPARGKEGEGANRHKKMERSKELAVRDMGEEKDDILVLKVKRRKGRECEKRKGES